MNPSLTIASFITTLIFCALIVDALISLVRAIVQWLTPGAGGG